jgi:hypothetical protein
MLQIHPNARTTPAVRAEIARSEEPTGALARRYGVSTETVRKWRKRGPEDRLDRSAQLRQVLDVDVDEAEVVVSEAALPPGGPGGWGRPPPAQPLGAEEAPDAVAVEVGQEVRDDEGEVVEGEVGGAAERADHGALLLRRLPGQAVRPETANGERRKRYSTSPATGARAPSTSPSRTMRRSGARSRSSGRPPPPSRSASPTC